MDVVGKKVETQVQFWSLLGPFFVLLSIAVLLFKVSPHWYFPVSALVGIPLCVKWKMKGMAAALCCLFLLAGISYQNLELDDRYWHVGLSLAMAFSFIVLTLSLEEVEGLVSKLQLESQSRLDNFLLLDEKWKNAEQQWFCEREKSKGEIGVLTQDLAKTQEDKQTFYKLAQLAKDELVQVRDQHDLLLQDLLYKKQQIAQLHERLEETEMTIQGFVNSDAEKQILAFTERVACLEQERETLQAKVAVAQKEGQACQLEREHLQQELQVCQELGKEYFQEKQDQQQTLQALQSKYAYVEQERQALLSAQVQLQQQCEQMRLLEAQYRQTTQQSQQKIQELETKLLEGEKQKEALQLRRREMEEQVLYQDRQAKQREEHYRNSFEQLQQQLEEEKHHVLTEMQDQLEAKNTALAEMQEKIDSLSMDLQEQQLLVKQSAEQNQRLENLKTQLEQMLQETQEKLQKVTQQQEESLSLEEEKHQLLKAMQDQLEAKNAALTEMQDKIDSLSMDLQEQQLLVKQSAEQNQRLENLKTQLEQMLQNTQEELQKVKQQQEESLSLEEEKHHALTEMQDQLEAKNAALTKMQEKIDSLSIDLQEQQLLVKQSTEQNQRLENLKTQLEQILQETQKELQKIKQQEEESPSLDKKLPYTTGNTRQVESMYLQLKEQFKQKSDVLDETRRELFRVNEELLKYRKKYEEGQIFDPPVNERRLQRYIVHLGSQFEQMQTLYQQEVDELTQLIGDLLQQM